MVLFYWCCCSNIRFHGAVLRSCTDTSLSSKIKCAAVSTGMQTQHLLFPFRFPWFLQFLHRRGVSGRPRAARDVAEFCFCFRHGGQEANEKVAGYADDELHQPTGGWDPLLWPAHLHQAPWPRQRAVLRPRTLQCHGQRRAATFSCFLKQWLFSDACGCLVML